MSKSIQLSFIPRLYGRTAGQADCCATKACMQKTKQCICMDSEQAGLLYKVLFQDTRIWCNLTPGQLMFQNLDVQISDLEFCMDRKDSPDGIGLFRYIEDPAVDQELSEAAKLGTEAIKKIICMFPVIMEINQTNPIDRRYSFLRLSCNSICADGFLEILFKIVIIAAGCYYLDPSDARVAEWIRQVLNALSKIFTAEELRKENQRIYNNCCLCYDRFEEIGGVYDSLAQYIRKYSDEVDPAGLSDEELRKRRLSVLKRSSSYYQLMLTVLHVAGIDGEWNLFPETASDCLTEEHKRLCDSLNSKYDMGNDLKGILMEVVNAVSENMDFV